MATPTTESSDGKTIGGVPVHNVAVSLLMCAEPAVPVPGGGHLANSN